MGMRSKKFSIGSTAILAIFTITLFLTGPRALGQQERVLHVFNNNGKDSEQPSSSLIFDAAGNLYGTTSGGGVYRAGTAFELSLSSSGWHEEELHNFGLNSVDGVSPAGGLIFDAAGNLFGTTTDGGLHGYGTVFELTPLAGGGSIEKVLHNFNNDGVDGIYPYGGVIFDGAGNLYGTASAGGVYGYGTVFELTPTGTGGWQENVLHDFGVNGSDGVTPFAGVIFDAAGNLYGTTFNGGADGGPNGGGTVFELTSAGGGSWTETVLRSFVVNGRGGSNPGALIVDASGNLYGPAFYGGSTGAGAVFELTHTAVGWMEKLLHNFQYSDGAFPNGLIFDAAGNLYGTTFSGGAYSFYGTVFELSPTASGGWTQKVLYSFNPNNSGGVSPAAGVILDSSGNVYGTTSAGGNGFGTAFELLNFQP